MNNKYETETLFRVYDNSNGTYIEVRPCIDVPDNILIHTPDKTSQDYFGPISMSMCKELAKALHTALGLQIEAMEVKG